MSPQVPDLDSALVTGTYEVFQADPDSTTVNKVRRHVEDALGLEEGFLATGDWKSKSKNAIKETVDKLLDGWKPDTKTATVGKSGTKRHGSAQEEPSPKRSKTKSQTPAATKKGAARGANNKKERLKASDDSEPEVNEDGKQEKQNPRQSGSASRSGDGPEEEAKDNGDDVVDAVPSGEEYSDVIDEAPKRSRKKDKKEAQQQKATSAAPAIKKNPTTEDPDEAEIKKLQSQLAKCGYRKFWHKELKQYGNDSRAKIKHLKRSLADLGMGGRFSEAKAREIRETRELLADVEAAQEMNSLWGTETGGRASRSQAKTKTPKVEEQGSTDDQDDDDDGGREKSHAQAGSGSDEEDEEEGNASFAARRRRAHADLAFLGDDSDSD